MAFKHWAQNTSTLEEFADFLQDNDSDGFRLAKFLQKKTGDVATSPRLLFADIEPPKYSFKVQVEKVIKKKSVELPKENVQVTEDASSIMKNDAEKRKQNENFLEQNIELNSHSQAISLPLPKINQNPVHETILQPLGTSCCVPTTPVSNVHSPKSGLSKSGGVSPGDRLRRYSLKRLSKISIGRRTLLNEFESTLSTTKFSPHIYSTPMKDTVDTIVSSNKETVISNTCSKSEKLLERLQQQDHELQAILGSAVENTISKRQETEKQVKEVVPGVISPTSTRCRSYTVEKGVVPGQVVLTPTGKSNCATLTSKDKTNAHIGAKSLEANNISRDCQSTFGQTKSDGPITKPGNNNELSMPSCYIIDSNCSKSQDVEVNKLVGSSETTEMPLVVIQKSQNGTAGGSFETVRERNIDTVICNIQNVNEALPQIDTTRASPKHISHKIQISITQSTEEGTKAKGQRQKTFGDNVSHANIPSTELNSGLDKEHVPSVPKQIEIGDIPTVAVDTPETTKVIHGEELRAADIFTEDEDEGSSGTSIQRQKNLSNTIPLDLVSRKTSARKRRSRKRTILSKPKIDRSQIQSTETETELELHFKAGPPRAHPLNLHRTQLSGARRRKLPLNKPPNTPINGEKFANDMKTHMARLTNREIMDLRKRNSLGKIYPISGRKSVAKKQEALEKQLKLEEVIEMELLKRQLENDNKPTENMIDLEIEVEAEQGTKVLLPAPPEFRDSAIAVPETAENAYSSSLVDEQACDRISFVSPGRYNKNCNNNNNTRGNKRSKPKIPVPEVLKNYLNVTKNISLTTKQRNQSKRSLYSQGNSYSEDNEQRSPLQITSVYSLRPSGYTDSSNPLCIVPPPLTMTPVSRSSVRLNRSAIELENLPLGPLPPPPEPFCDATLANTVDDVEDVASISKTFRKTCRNTLRIPVMSGVEPLSPTSSTSSDVAIFKKQPLSKSRRKQPTTNVNSTTTNSGVVSNNTQSDTEIFKKPSLPAPKTRKARKPKEVKSVEAELRSRSPLSPLKNSSSDGQSESTESGQTLRRSKRGHVPLKNTWSFHTTDPTPLFHIMYQETMIKRIKAQQSRINRISTSVRTQSHSVRTASSTITAPVHHSTLNEASKAATMSSQSSKRSKKTTGTEQQENAEARVYSYLGDSNTISSISSVSSVNRRQLSPIREQHLPAIPESAKKEAVPKKRRKSSKNPRKKGANAKQKTETENHDVGIASASTVVAVDRAATSATADADAPSTSRTTRSNKGLECSRIVLSSAPVDKLNNLFDRLKNNTLNNNGTTSQESMHKNQLAPLPEQVTPSCKSQRDAVSTSSTRKLRVRVQRIRPEETPLNHISREKKKNNDNEVSSDTQAATNRQEKTASSIKSPGSSSNSSNSSTATTNSELLNWLKGLSNSQTTRATNKMFKEMHCSAAGNLVFAVLEGIDYAFYDTDKKASLGYLRFRALQSKPTKRAKTYHLHFVVLAGTFKIKTDSDIGYFSPGDMIAINKGSRYSLQNITNETAIVMVIKR